jgi:hypothetical protein
MKRRKIIIKILIIIGILGSLLLINFYVIIRPNIYYRIEYTIENPYPQAIIDRVELFNYSKYLDCTSRQGGKCYFDRDSLNYYKSRVDEDVGFHINPWYTHHFIYTFNAANHSGISLTYNNNTIFNCTYSNSTSVFYLPSTNIWYLNLSILTPVNNTSSTLLLSNITIVEILFFYIHYYFFTMGGSYTIYQYIFLDDSLEVILIYVSFIITAP